MEKKTIMGVATILMILYAGGVILNPHLRVDKNTVFIKGDMGDILGVSSYGAPLSEEKRDDGLEAYFTDPVSTVFLQVHRSVLDAEPNRIRFDIAILSQKELIINVSMRKVLDLRPRETQAVGKPYIFSNNESCFVYLRVWELKGTRDEEPGETFTDSVRLQVVTPYTWGGASDQIRGVVIHSFRYVTYGKGEGKRGVPMSLGLNEFLLYYVPFILALFVPFLLFMKRSWRDFSP